MKLLLTSGGITNESIARALFDLVGKKPEDTSLVVIPTASNVETGDKSWSINDLVNLKRQNFKSIDIADISAVEEHIWRPKLEAADVLFFEGGSTYHVMTRINKSGLVSLLPEFLKTKVYVGVSAGSMVASNDIALKMNMVLYEEDSNAVVNIQCLNLVNFYFLPHLNSPDFNLRTKEFVIQAAEGISEKIYALDDSSALKIIDDHVEVVTEGEWFTIN